MVPSTEPTFTAICSGSIPKPDADPSRGRAGDFPKEVSARPLSFRNRFMASEKAAAV
jgi:hypothetical protein